MKNNSMKSRPITSRSKGTPLHSEETEDPKKLGKMNVVDAQGNLLEADDNVTTGSPGKPAETKIVVEDYSKDWDKEAAGGLSYAEWIKVPGNKKKEEDFVKSKTKTITTEGTEGTSGKRTTSYNPKLTEGKEADKVDTFLPWERRFAQRTQRGAVRDEIRRGKKGMKQLDKALKAGVISQEDYDRDYAEASKLAFGQGTIAKGQYTNTAGMDAILSQGYQANPAVSTQTDMLRKPQGEQKAGQPVKADGSEQMTQAEYEAGGKGKTTPKTSAAVQDASSKAGASVTEDQAKQESNELPSLSTADLSVQQRLFDRDGDASGEEIKIFEPIESRAKSSDMFKGEGTDLNIIDANAPMGSEGPATSTPRQSQPNQKESKESSPGPIGGKGVETDNLDDLAPISDTDPISQADDQFGSDGVVVKPNAGAVGGKGVETDNLSDIQSSLSTPSESDLSDGTPTAPANNSVVSTDKPVVTNPIESNALNDALENALAKDRTAFKKTGYKMNRSHSPSMMYNKNAPTRKMGSPLNKFTDLSGDGDVTQKDILIGRGVLNRDGSPAQLKKSNTAFKMKGYGKK